MSSFRQDKYDIFQSVQKHIKVSKMFLYLKNNKKQCKK